MKFLRDNLNYLLPSALFFGVISFILLRKYFKSSPFLDITKNYTQDKLKFLYFRFVSQYQTYQKSLAKLSAERRNVNLAKKKARG